MQEYKHDDYVEKAPTLFSRVRCACGLLLGLRYHDFRAARTFISEMYAGQALIVRLYMFVVWTLGQIFSAIPAGMQGVSEVKPVDKTPIWLAGGNPLANHPWSQQLSCGVSRECRYSCNWRRVHRRIGSLSLGKKKPAKIALLSLST